MAIDEERLEEIEKRTEMELGFTDSAHLGSAEAMELIRLARLGLWAEKYGVPALRTPGGQLACDCCDSGKSVQEHFDKALAELQKEGTP